MGSLILMCALAVFAWSLTAMSLLSDDAAVVSAEADTEATQFLTYHQAVAAWVIGHPGFAGTAPGSALAFPAGYVANPAWTHQVVDGVGYTYLAPTYVVGPEFVDFVGSVGGSVCVRRSAGNLADCGYGALGAAARVLPTSVASVVATGRFVIATH